MEINLSNEMIEKITCVANGRVRELHRKIKEANEMDAVLDREKARKNILLNDLNKALAEAEEVHSLFFGLLSEQEA